MGAQPHGSMAILCRWVSCCSNEILIKEEFGSLLESPSHSLFPHPRSPTGWLLPCCDAARMLSADAFILDFLTSTTMGRYYPDYGITLQTHTSWLRHLSSTTYRDLRPKYTKENRTLCTNWPSQGLSSSQLPGGYNANPPTIQPPFPSNS